VSEVVGQDWPPPPSVERGWRSTLVATAKDALVIIGLMALLGVVCGFLWSQLAEPDQLIRFKEGVGQDELQLSRVFGVDGWYAVIAAVAAFLAGLVFGFWRTRDLLATLVLLLVGCAVAAAVMWGVGHVLGPDDPSTLLQHADVGDTADAPLDRPAWAVFLAWPVPALAGILVPLLFGRD